MDWSAIGNKAANSGITNTLSIVESIGESALHMLAPDNFEYYQCSLELLDVEKNQVGFISFVVMPNNISESRAPIQTQVKTRSGVVTNFNDSFAPVNITLQGTFGRRFRIVTGIVDPSPKRWNGWGNFFNGNMGKAMFGFETAYKSGYGLTKVLKFILEKANELDSKGRPYILLYNNYAFNTSYVVDVVNSSFNQSIENNRLWFYEISLKAVAPASAVQTEGQRNAKLLKMVASNAIAQGLSNVVKDVKRNNDLMFI